MSLKTKILGGVTAVLAGVSALITAGLLADAVARRAAQAREKGELYGNLVEKRLNQGPALDPAPPWDLVRWAIDDSPFLSGWKAVSPRARPTGEIALGVETAHGLDDALDAGDELSVRASLRDKKVRLDGRRVYVPIDTHWGPHVLRFDFKGYEAGGMDLTRNAYAILFLMICGSVALILITRLLLERMVLRPLGAIVEGARRISGGDYSKGIPELPRADEVAMVIQAINSMMERIEAYHLTLKEDIRKARTQASTAETRLIHAQRLSTTGTLAAGIAHEINNPLGGMINATEALRSGRLGPDKQKEYLELIADGLQRVRTIVQQVLHFRPRAVQPVPVQIREMVNRAIAFIEHKARAKDVEIVNEVPAELPPMQGDALELQQAVLNILLNGVDACRQGGRVEVTASLGPERLSIIMRDNGIGMDAEQVARCMEPFFTTKDQGEGTGLGLAVAASIVENHRGKIHIDSRPGAGTTVRFDFPPPVPVGALQGPSTGA